MLFFRFKYTLIILLLVIGGDLFASNSFDRQDTLRGKLTPMRSCFDVISYDLDIDINMYNKSISGSNKINFSVVRNFDSLQIDLFSNMVIDSIIYENDHLEYKRDGNATYVYFPWELMSGTFDQIIVFYHGTPIEALSPPWDGGFVWSKDERGNPWLGVACEGVGASLWWPNKDHLTDEPEEMTIHLTVPSNLMGVSNGMLVNKKKVDKKHTKYTWKVRNPINNYNVTLNVADYVYLNDNYVNHRNDTLRLDYYVLKDNYLKAKEHFKQVKPMLTFFEEHFGKYAFYEDSYKLVESNYWGMEHQSCIAYGNHYLNNKYDFDFIILHESAHEWFGNSLTCNDHAEMWIHEAFATYSEALFVEKTKGYLESLRYLKESKDRILNREPMVGPLDVNYNDWDGSDIYYKGSWMLHTLRSVIDDDKLWFELLKQFAIINRKKNVSTTDFIKVVNAYTGVDYSYFFEQYLLQASIPIFKYKLQKGRKGNIELQFKWETPTDGFVMPVKIETGNLKERLLFPTDKWQSILLRNMSLSDFKIADHLYLVKSEQIK